MKKKIIYILGVLFIIIIFFIIVFILINNNQEKKEYNRLISTSWSWSWDEYYSTKQVNFSGTVIPNKVIYFNENKMNFCSEEQNELEEKANGELKCTGYNYTVDDNIITVDYNNEKIVYTFGFTDNGELILTYNGDGFEFLSFYVPSLG